MDMTPSTKDPEPMPVAGVGKKPAGKPIQNVLLTKIAKLQNKGLVLHMKMKQSKGKKYLFQQMSDLNKLLKDADGLKKSVVSVKGKKEHAAAEKWLGEIAEVMKSSHAILKSYRKSEWGPKASQSLDLHMVCM